MKKTIFITGVGKRIGYALAKHFLTQGHRVIGTYRSHYPSLDELTELGASLYQCDLSDPQGIDELIALVLQNHQRLDSLIHNASDWLADKQADLSPSDVMARMMQIHVSAPYQLNLGLAPLLTYSYH
jgi:dihydromonapterin reductase/dihydrofolate reductase